MSIFGTNYCGAYSQRNADPVSGLSRHMRVSETSCYVNSFHTYVLHGAYIGLQPKVCGAKEAYDLVDLACGVFALLQFYHKIVVFE